MNSLSQVIMSIAYALFLLSTIPNMRIVWKNKDKLKGFSKFGATATTIGLAGTQSAFLIDGAYIPFIIGIPNLIYWIILVYFIYRNDVNK